MILSVNLVLMSLDAKILFSQCSSELQMLSGTLIVQCTEYMLSNAQLNQFGVAWTNCVSFNSVRVAKSAELTHSR